MIAFHATRRACRESIFANGLLPNRPSEHQPCGVYVFTDRKHSTMLKGGRPCTWGHAPGLDLWRVTYDGPIIPDRFVSNGYILLETVPANSVTLVIGN